MTDKYKYINKGLQITRSMDIYNYTSTQRSIDIDRHRHTHTVYMYNVYMSCIQMCVKGGVGPLCMNAHL